MSWSALTPYLPFVRLFAAALAVGLAALAVWQVRDDAKLMTWGAAVARNRRIVAAATVFAVLAGWLGVGGGSAYRPKDRVDADHGARAQMLQLVDQATPGGVPEARPRTPDWAAARAAFRDQARQDQQQFERAAERPDPVATGAAP